MRGGGSLSPTTALQGRCYLHPHTVTERSARASRQTAGPGFRPMVLGSGAAGILSPASQQPVSTGRCRGGTEQCKHRQLVVTSCPEEHCSERHAHKGASVQAT